MKKLIRQLTDIDPAWKFLLLLYTGLVLVHVIDLHMYLMGSLDTKSWHSWHNGIVHGHGFYPDQYRPLTYWLAELVYRGLIIFHLCQSNLAFEYSHLLVRFVFMFLSLFLLHLFLRKWFPSSACTVASVFVASVLPLSVIRCSTCVTDPLNLLIFIVGYWLIRDDKPFWLIPVLLIGMMNRETTGLLVVAYVLVNIGRSWRRWIPIATLLVITVVIVYLGIRILYGPRHNWAPTSAFYYFQTNFLWTTWEMIILFIGPWLFWAFGNLKSKPVFLRRCLFMLLFLFIGHSTSGHIREVRYWLPVFPIILPLAMWSIWSPSRSNMNNK